MEEVADTVDTEFDSYSSSFAYRATSAVLQRITALRSNGWLYLPTQHYIFIVPFVLLIIPESKLLVVVFMPVPHSFA